MSARRSASRLFLKKGINYLSEKRQGWVEARRPLTVCCDWGSALLVGKFINAILILRLQMVRYPLPNMRMALT